MEFFNSFFRRNTYSGNKECSPTGYNDVQELIELATRVIILVAAPLSVRL